MTKVLWLSDFNCSTGFGTVAHNILAQLQKTGRYEFTVVGINHTGKPYDRNKWPFDIYPAVDMQMAGEAYRDVFGRQQFLDLLIKGDYDLVFVLQDTFIVAPIGAELEKVKDYLKKNNQKVFTSIYYYPVDGLLETDTIKKSVGAFDFPVTYTQFAKTETQRVCPELNPAIIPHGVDLQTFRPLDPIEVAEFRAKFFSSHADGKFIVTNVNRNQPRKDIARTIAAFAKFHLVRPDSYLYLLMQMNDVGGNVARIADLFGLKPIIDYAVPVMFNTFSGYPIERVNQIYNASDVVVSSTLGEGWGLSSIEAMATKTPVIFPNNTALTEIVTGRGRLVKSGEGNSWVCLGQQDMNQIRPTVDVDDLARGMIEAYDNRDEEQIEAAYNWVQTLSWDRVGEMWQAVFEQAAGQALPERNDQCYRCANKWKKCELHNMEVMHV